MASERFNSDALWGILGAVLVFAYPCMGILRVIRSRTNDLSESERLSYCPKCLTYFSPGCDCACSVADADDHSNRDNKVNGPVDRA
jgi:hypothetical protein